MKIFIIAFLFFQSVQCYNDSITFKQKGSGGAPQGDLIMQRITISTIEVHQLFWWEDKSSVYYGDTFTDTIHSWNYDGTKRETYISEVSGENIAFIMPIRRNKNKLLLASDNNLRILTLDDTDITASDPVVVIKEEGYSIEKGHCASDGTLYLILCHLLNIGKPTLFYKVKEEKAELVYTFPSEVSDFVFSNDFTKIFVVGNDGKSVIAYDFDIDSGQLSNEKEVYNVETDNLGYKTRMSSIVIDNDDNLWITTKNSYVLRVTNEYILDKIVQTPYCGLTSIVFGGHRGKNILMGSSKICHEDEMQEGSVLIMTGLNSTGKFDELVKWAI